jgi:outer membrane protein
MKKLTKLMAIALAATTLSSGAAMASDYGPWQVRFRAILISPDETSSTSIGGFTDHSDQIVPEMDISYFFNDNFSAELILGVSKHSGNAWNTAAGDLDIGSVWALPPTLTLQYHAMPGQMINPYVGVGANLTIFFGEDDLPAGSPITSISHSASIGPAVQAGVDIQTGGDWFLNADIKKVWMQTDATMQTVLGTVTADVSLDPWIFGVGFGRRF